MVGKAMAWPYHMANSSASGAESTSLQMPIPEAEGDGHGHAHELVLVLEPGHPGHEELAGLQLQGTEVLGDDDVVAGGRVPQRHAGAGVDLRHLPEPARPVEQVLDQLAFVGREQLASLGQVVLGDATLPDGEVDDEGVAHHVADRREELGVVGVAAEGDPHEARPLGLAVGEQRQLVGHQLGPGREGRDAVVGAAGLELAADRTGTDRCARRPHRVRRSGGGTLPGRPASGPRDRGRRGGAG